MKNAHPRNREFALRHQSREHALQLLFSWEFGDAKKTSAEALWSHFSKSSVEAHEEEMRVFPPTDSHTAPIAVETALPQSKEHEITWDERTKNYALELAKAVLDHRVELDALIAQYSYNWRPDRIAKVEYLILCLALAEVLFLKNIPARVAISEAITLGLEFSTDDCKRFINGMLDSILRTACPGDF